MGYHFWGFQTGNNFDWSDVNVGNYRRSRNVLETPRFSFDLDTCEARSYDWWVFVLRIGNTIYFNDASYSMQTRQHQKMAQNILRIECPEEHGIKIKTVYVREGLNHLDTAIKNRQFEISQLTEAMNTPRSWKSTNSKRRERIRDLKKEIAEYRKLVPLVKSQLDKNKDLKDEVNHMRDIGYLRKELVTKMRERHPSRIILRASAFVAVRTTKFRTTKAPNEELHVMSLRDFRSMDLPKKFPHFEILELRPVPGKTRDEAVAFLKQEVTVAFVTARMTGEPNPIQVVVK